MPAAFPSLDRTGRIQTRNGEDKARAAEAEEAAARAPGMGRALLAVLVMILSTLVLAALIFMVMLMVVPADRRTQQKAPGVEQPLPQPPVAKPAPK